MKKYALLPVISVLGGAAAFVLRLLQNRTGFEAATGLPVPGNFPGLALVICFAVLAAALLLLARTLPKDTGEDPVFPAAFATDNTTLLFLPVAGILLIALSGLTDLYEGLTQGNLLSRMKAAADPYAAALEETCAGFPSRTQLLLGVLTLLSAAALFLSAVSCRKKAREDAKPFSGNLLLGFPVVLVVRLVLTYRLDSVDPALAAYYVEILALVFLTLAFYRLSSFAFKAGRTTRFALYTGLSAVFSRAALADGGPLLSSLMLYAGGAVTVLGFLTLRLCSADAE